MFDNGATQSRDGRALAPLEPLTLSTKLPPCPTNATALPGESLGSDKTSNTERRYTLDSLADPPHRGALEADGALGTDQLQ